MMQILELFSVCTSRTLKSSFLISLAILFTMRTVLGSIFTAIYLAILNNKLPAEIHSHVESAATAAGLPSAAFPSLFAAVANGTTAAYNAVPNMTPAIQVKIIDAVTDGRVKSYSYVYYATIAVNAVPIIAGLLMKDYDHLLNSHVPRQVYRHGKGADRSLEEEANEKAHSGHHDLVEEGEKHSVHANKVEVIE